MSIVLNGSAGTISGIAAGGLGSVTDLSNDTTPQLGGSLDMNNLNITCNDSSSGGNNRIVMGNGADFQFWHDGSHSYIADEGTGNLILLTSKLNVNNAAGTEALIHASENGKIELYHDNKLKCETRSDGINIIGDEGASAGVYIISDEGDDNADYWRIVSNQDHNDLTIAHKGSGSYINRMTIDSGGRTDFVANKSNSQMFHLQNDGSTMPEGITMLFPNTAPNTASAHFFKASDSSTTRIVIDTNGNLRNTNNSYGSISDVSLKENIVDASSQWDDIKNVKVRVFNFKTDDASEKRIGVIAQEIETVCPKLVDELPDRDSDNKRVGTSKKSVKYSVLYMKAIKALQEAQARIETLETKVAALEAA